MNAFSLRCTILDTGRTLLLDKLTDIQLAASLSSPARSLRVTAAVGQLPQELRDATLYYGERELFSGRVDRQEGRLARNGKSVALEARSKGGILLDNESRPRVLWGTNIATMFRNTLAPYGFGLYNPQPARTAAVYSVGKGVSEWDAFCGLCMRMHSVLPYVEGDTVMVCPPQSGAVLRISNSGNGVPYSDLRWVHLPYAVLSRVVIRDENGSYSTAVQNPAAARYQMQRKRYMIPTAAFEDAPALDANQRIRASMRERVKVSVTVPEVLEVQCGQQVEIADTALTLYNLRVEQWKLRANGGGYVSELTLGDSVYV
jgi:hypothetical protein